MKTREQYEAEILKVIKEENIFFISDIFAFYKGCSRSTFYTHELDKLDTIKNAIDDNKVLTKYQIKSNWLKSNNPTLQLALFKIICSDDERMKLSMNYLNIEKPKEIGFDLSKLSDQVLDELLACIKD